MLTCTCAYNIDKYSHFSHLFNKTDWLICALSDWLLAGRTGHLLWELVWFFRDQKTVHCRRFLLVWKEKWRLHAFALQVSRVIRTSFNCTDKSFIHSCFHSFIHACINLCRTCLYICLDVTIVCLYIAQSVPRIYTCVCAWVPVWALNHAWKRSAVF